MVTSGQPTHEPSTFICVLKGIQEYILHMLYCRFISNSTAVALEEIAVTACRCILSSPRTTRGLTRKVSRILPHNFKYESSIRIILFELSHYYQSVNEVATIRADQPLLQMSESVCLINCEECLLQMKLFVISDVVIIDPEKRQGTM